MSAAPSLYEATPWCRKAITIVARKNVRDIAIGSIDGQNDERNGAQSRHYVREEIIRAAGSPMAGGIFDRSRRGGKGEFATIAKAAEKTTIEIFMRDGNLGRTHGFHQKLDI